MNQEEGNQKILELMNKNDFLLKEEIQLFKRLMFQCNLKIKNRYGYTPLMYALVNNESQNLNEEQIDYLIRNSDLKQQNNNGYTPLIYVFAFKKTQNLKLKTEQFDYLIKNSDLTQKNYIGDTPLMYAFMYNKTQHLNLSENQINYLIKKSDLKQQQQNNGWTPFMYAFAFNKTQNLNLKKKQFKTMYDALDEEQQQITFQKSIKENIENDNQYLEEINLLLYDCEFKPNEKTIHWLTKNKHQDILEMIEKRNLLFQLNQDLKEMNHHQKITTIKI